MKKVNRSKYISISLFFLPISAYCQIWDFLISSETGNSYYVDTTAIKKFNSSAKYSQLTNYPNGYQIHGKEIKSLIKTHVNDCKEHRFKINSGIGYSDFYGKGSIEFIYFDEKNNWIPIKNEMVSYHVHKEVCK